MTEMKQWKCKSGHVMGQVQQNGHGSHRLYLFRQALDMNAEHPTELDVIAIVEGYVADVRCSVPGCGAVRTWIPGDIRMEKLLERQREGVADAHA